MGDWQVFPKGTVVVNTRRDDPCVSVGAVGKVDRYNIDGHDEVRVEWFEGEYNAAPATRSWWVYASGIRPRGSATGHDLFGREVWADD